MILTPPTLEAPADGKARFSAFSVPVLKVRDLPGPLWDLQDWFGFYSEITREWSWVPPKFRTDGCSIPDFALSLTGHVADEPGYIHDGLYTSRKYPREVCDRILSEMMRVRGYSTLKADGFYLAVRTYGGAHWDLPNVPQEAPVALHLGIAEVA